MPALLLVAIPVAASAWVALLLAAPAARTELGIPVYLFGGFICHQIAERSFHLDGIQLPVCARCFGIYAGAAMAAVVAWREPFRVRAASLTRLAPRALLLASALPTIVTVVLEWAGIWDPGNGGRAIAGTVLGAGVALAVMAAIHYEQ